MKEVHAGFAFVIFSVKIFYDFKSCLRLFIYKYQTWGIVVGKRAEMRVVGIIRILGTQGFYGLCI